MTKNNTAQKLTPPQVDAANATIEANQNQQVQAKVEEAREKDLREAGFRRSRPAYELGVISGFGRMAEGTFASVVEGGFQVLAPIAVLAAVGFGTGVIPVPGRAGATCGD